VLDDAVCYASIYIYKSIRRSVKLIKADMLLGAGGRDARLEASSVCPYDACWRSSLPCRCTKNCSVSDQCDKSHHPLYSGQVKDVIFGIACPPEMQRALTYALRDIGPATKLVTVIVNITLNSYELLGELETMKQIDTIDPAGEFTAKLFHEQVLEPQKRWYRGTYYNPAIDNIMHKLLKDDTSASLKKHYALDGCDCGSGRHKLLCCETHSIHCKCERCKYEKLRLRMHDWSTQPVRLHYMFMQFAGASLDSFVGDSMSEKTICAGFQRLLTNYIKLHENGISHLDLHDKNITWSVGDADGVDHTGICAGGAGGAGGAGAAGATGAAGGAGAAGAAGAAGVVTGDLHFKFIDFGFNQMDGSDEDDMYLKFKHGRTVLDVTKWYTGCCKVTQELRWWHPVEYPMFHLCASLLYAPLLLPGNRWTRQDHANKVLQMAALAPASFVMEDDVVDYAHVTTELHQYFANCPTVPGIGSLGHTECSRNTFFKDLFGIFENLRYWYKPIHQHLQAAWVRVCSIVGTEIARTRFLADGQGRQICCNSGNFCEQGAEMFSEFPGYRNTLDVFRTQYYYCEELDIATVEREFDTFSLAMNILRTSSDRDVDLRRVVHTHLLSSSSFERNRTKLADAAVELGRVSDNVKCRK